MHNILIGSKLANLLNGKVNIDPPNTEILTRIGSIVKYENKNVIYVAEPAVQFSLATNDEGKKWFVGNGPAIPCYEEEFKASFDDAIKEFANRMIDFANGNTIKFNLMFLPQYGIEQCILEVHERLVIRYIADYMPSTDKIARRFDVMIVRENKHA